MESAKPEVAQAKYFAEGVLAKNPGQFLAYNLSPSFNWDKAGMTDAEIRSFITDLGKLGFVFQFITLAGMYACLCFVFMFCYYVLFCLCIVFMYCLCIVYVLFMYVCM